MEPPPVRTSPPPCTTPISPGTPTPPLSSSSPNPLPNDHSLISYKPKIEDRNKDLLHQLGIIIDSKGTPDPRCKNIEIPPLEEKGMTRYNKYLYSPINIVCEGLELDFREDLPTPLSVNSFSFHLRNLGLNGVDFQTRDKDSKDKFNIIRVYFNLFLGKFIGSSGLKIGGLELIHEVIKRAAYAVKAQNEATNSLLDKLFSDESLRSYHTTLEGPLADLDIRLLINKGFPEEFLPVFIDCFVYAIMWFIKPFDKNKRVRAKEILITRNKCWENFDLDHPQFEAIFIRNAAFRKLNVYCDAHTKYAIGSYGNGLLREFMCLMDSLRPEMFPSVQYPIYLLPNNVPGIYPEGSVLQAVIDFLCGWVRPNTAPILRKGKRIIAADYFDIKALATLITKGKTYPDPLVIQELLSISRQALTDPANPTVIKINSVFTSLIPADKNIFSLFWWIHYSDVVENHLFQNPEAAVALTFNAANLLRLEATEKEVNNFILLMKKNWEKTINKNHIAYFISQLLCDVTVPFDKRFAPLELLSFLHCQAERNKSLNSPITINPRDVKSKLLFEISFQTTKGKYSIFCNGENQTKALQQTLAYINNFKAKNDLDSLAMLENLVMAFFPRTQFKGKQSSPMLADLKLYIYSINKMIDTSLEFMNSAIKVERLLSLLFLLSSQSIHNGILPTDKFLINLLQLLQDTHYEDHYIKDNLCDLFPPTIASVLHIKIESLKNEKDPKKKLNIWFSHLSDCKTFSQIAYELWTTQVIPDNDTDLKKELALVFLKNNIGTEHATSICFLQQCCTHKLFSAVNMLIWIKSLGTSLKTIKNSDYIIPSLGNLLKEFIKQFPLTAFTNIQLNDLKSTDTYVWIATQLVKFKYVDEALAFLKMLLKLQVLLPADARSFWLDLMLSKELKRIDHIFYFLDGHESNIWNFDAELVQKLDKWIFHLLSENRKRESLVKIESARRIFATIPAHLRTKTMTKSLDILQPKTSAAEVKSTTLPIVIEKPDSEVKTTTLPVEIEKPKESTPQKTLANMLQEINPDKNPDDVIEKLLEIITTTNSSNFSELYVFFKAFIQKLILSQNVEKCLILIRKKEIQSLYANHNPEYFDLLNSILGAFDSNSISSNSKAYIDFVELLLNSYSLLKNVSNETCISLVQHITRSQLTTFIKDNSFPKTFIKSIQPKTSSIFAKLRQNGSNYDFLKFHNFLILIGQCNIEEKLDYLFLLTSIQTTLQKKITSEDYLILHSVISNFSFKNKFNIDISDDVLKSIYVEMAKNSASYDVINHYLFKLKELKAFDSSKFIDDLFFCVSKLTESHPAEAFLLCQYIPNPFKLFKSEWEKIYLALIEKLITNNIWHQALECIVSCPLSISDSTFLKYQKYALKILQHYKHLDKQKEEKSILHNLNKIFDAIKLYKLIHPNMWLKFFSYADQLNQDSITSKMWAIIQLSFNEEETLFITREEKMLNDQLWMITAQAVAQNPHEEIIVELLERSHKLKRICKVSLSEQNYADFYIFLLRGLRKALAKSKPDSQKIIPSLTKCVENWIDFLKEYHTVDKLIEVEMEFILILSDRSGEHAYQCSTQRFSQLLDRDNKYSEQANYTSLERLPENSPNGIKYREVISRRLMQTHNQDCSVEVFSSLADLVDIHIRLKMPTFDLLSWLVKLKTFYAQPHVEIPNAKLNLGIKILANFVNCVHPTIPTSHVHKMNKFETNGFLEVALPQLMHNQLKTVSDFIIQPSFTNLVNHNQRCQLAAMCVENMYIGAFRGEFLDKRTEANQAFNSHFALISTNAVSYTKCLNLLSRVIVENCILYNQPDFILTYSTTYIHLYQNDLRKFFFSIILNTSSVLSKLHIEPNSAIEAHLLKFLLKIIEFANLMLKNKTVLTKDEIETLLCYLTAVLTHEKNMLLFLKDSDCGIWSISGTVGVFQHCVDMVSLFKQAQVLDVSTLVELQLLIELKYNQESIMFLEKEMASKAKTHILMRVINRYVKALEIRAETHVFRNILHLCTSCRHILFLDRNLLNNTLQALYQVLKEFLEKQPKEMNLLFNELNVHTDYISAYENMGIETRLSVKFARLHILHILPLSVEEKIDLFNKVYNYYLEIAENNIPEDNTRAYLVRLVLDTINHISIEFEKRNESSLELDRTIEIQHEIFFRNFEQNALLFSKENFIYVEFYERMTHFRIMRKIHYKSEDLARPYYRKNMERFLEILKIIDIPTTEIRLKRAKYMENWIKKMADLGILKSYFFQESLDLIEKAIHADIFKEPLRSKKETQNELLDIVQNLRVYISDKALKRV